MNKNNKGGIDRNVVMWAHSNIIMMLYVHIWHYMELY